MSFFFLEGQVLQDHASHPCILLWQHLTQYTSGCNTRSKHTQDLDVLSLHLACASKAQLTADWTGKIITYSQPTKLTARWHAHVNSDADCTRYPHHPYTKHVPAGRRNFLSIWLLPLLHLYSETNSMLSPSGHREELGSNPKIPWGRVKVSLPR